MPSRVLFWASHATVKTDRTNVQMNTEVIWAVFTPESIAIAKAIAPDGPATFRTDSCDHCFDHSPLSISKVTNNSTPNNFTAETRQTIFVGAKLLTDKFT